MPRLIAILARPKDLDRAAALLIARGLAPAEARMRLAPEPPTVILRLADDESEALAAALTGAGTPALAIEGSPDAWPEPFLARSFELGPAQATFIGRDGSEVELNHGGLRLILRGMRMTSAETVRTELKRKFSAGKALLTQGLMMTKVEKKEIRSTVTQWFHVAMVYGTGGDGVERAVLLDEAELTYQSLGKALKPSRVENLNTVVAELRKRAPSARYDDRLLRLGTRALALHNGNPFDLLAEVLSRAQRLELW